MKIKLTNYTSNFLRFKLAELLASKKLKAISTTKYPPEILDTEFFNDMSMEDKDFLRKFWTTFDLFKPIFQVVNEIPKYEAFILYEVKSKVINKNNEGQIEKPLINLSVNQNKFFNECKNRNIPIKFFLAYYLEDWEIEYKEFDYSELNISLRPDSVWNEERMKRIKASKLNQFWHDLFPSYVLYKVNENELKNIEEINDYIHEVIKTPLSESEKQMLINRAKKLHKKIPKSLIVENFGIASKRNIKENYHIKLEEIKQKYPRVYESWSLEEEKQLSDLYSKEKTISEIAEILMRQRGAIRSRLKKLGLLNEKI